MPWTRTSTPWGRPRCSAGRPPPVTAVSAAGAVRVTVALPLPAEREVGRCVTSSQGCAPSSALRKPLSDVGCPLSVCGPRSVVVMM